MTSVKQIYDCLNGIAPISLKMDFDNVGLLVGDGNETVNTCVIALDITDEVIQEAIAQNAQLIISHHPIIFGSVKSVTTNDLVGSKIISLIKNDISAICMHTNLDISEGGVNDVLISALSASSSGILEPCGTDSYGEPVGCGRVGELDNEIEFYEFLSLCKSALGSNGLRYHYAGKPVKRLAVMGGSGGGSLMNAVKSGCDTYVTADVKYNCFLDAKELGINLIDADHFCTENVIVPVIASKLREHFPDVNFVISRLHKQTIKFF